MTPATSDLHDAHGDKLRICKLKLVQYGRRRRFYGRIRTAALHADLVVLKGALDAPAAGCILVVDAQGRLDAALLGDHLAAYASQLGWQGIVINGALRDAETLPQVDLGIMAAGTCPKRAALSGPIALDEPVSFGELQFVPGQWIYCDDDGIVVSDQDLSCASP